MAESMVENLQKLGPSYMNQRKQVIPCLFSVAHVNSVNRNNIFSIKTIQALVVALNPLHLADYIDLSRLYEEATCVLQCTFSLDCVMSNSSLATSLGMRSNTSIASWSPAQIYNKYH